MKLLLLAAMSLVSLVSNASEVNPAEALLHQMSAATNQLNYEMSYIRVRKNSIDPLRYRHSIVDGKAFDQVAYLTGPSRETIRRGDEISYFEQGIEPFTIVSQQMVVPLPSIMLADINHLSTMYDFVPLGRGREAGLASDVVRVSPKDGQRYSYVLWIDQKSKLLVRADLLDRDGDPIEQYRVLSLIISPDIAKQMAALAEIELPVVLQMPEKQSPKLGWKVTDLPDGFKPVFSYRHRFKMSERPVESLLFSDGLFSFSVYIAKADNLSVRGQLVRKGRRTLHSILIGNVEVTVVGDIPPATAKAVAESVRFSETKPKPKDALEVGTEAS